MRRHKIVILTTLLALAAHADDFWKKPYQKWSADETAKLLEESPWAQSKTIGQTVINTPSRGSGGNPTQAQIAGSVEVQNETSPQVKYVLQLRSALPVREAIVRQGDLRAGYDKMSAAQQQAGDANAQKYLAGNYADRIVVYVIVTSNIHNYQNQLNRYWDTTTKELLKNTVFLNHGKDRFEPTGFAARDNAFQFTFARPADLGEEDTISIEFQAPPIDILPQQRMFFEFKVRKMIVSGKPEL